MKKLIMLISLLILSLTSFSQNAISIKDSVVVLPSKTARLVIKDLISYDAVRLELKTTQELLLSTESKVNNQYMIIKQYEIKDTQYKQTIDNYDYQIIAYKNITDNLKRDLKRTKLKLIYNKTLLIAVAAAGTYFYISK